MEITIKNLKKYLNIYSNNTKNENNCGNKNISEI